MPLNAAWVLLHVEPHVHAYEWPVVAVAAVGLALAIGWLLRRQV